MEAEGGYTYRGEEGEVVPGGATHIFVSAKVIRALAFVHHPNIVEIICHEDVETIEARAFLHCRSLKRVIMRGVKIVELLAFTACGSLTDVECVKLEIIGLGAFCECKSLRSINLTSARIVEMCAFKDCPALMDAEFGSKLERIDVRAFVGCKSIARITIPFNNGIITDDKTFQGCEKLNHVNLVCYAFRGMEE